MKQMDKSRDKGKTFSRLLPYPGSFLAGREEDGQGALYSPLSLWEGVGVRAE
jgi:hypothetical protein